jgi:hypothetical protein
MFPFCGGTGFFLPGKKRRDRDPAKPSQYIPLDLIDLFFQHAGAPVGAEFLFENTLIQMDRALKDTDQVRKQDIFRPLPERETAPLAFVRLKDALRAERLEEFP